MAYIQSNNPFKQKSDQVVIDGKTYPKGYTKKDVKFLKEQKEDVVRREDLDAKGKAIYDANIARAEAEGKKAKTKKDDVSPVKGFVSAAQRKAVWASKNEKK